MKPGEVILLNTKTNQDVVVQVATRTCFKARIGKVGNHIAAQITDEITPQTLSELLL